MTIANSSTENTIVIPISVHANDLREKISNRTAVVGVIGLGYVGLPLVKAFHSADFPVMGFDVDPSKIESLRMGRSYLKHLNDGFVHDLSTSDRFEATTEFDRLADADVLLICVPTPLGKHLEPDLSYVEQTADAASASLRPGQLVVLESTTYPGTTRDLVQPRLEKTGLKCGEDFFIAYSPEREDPGRKDFTTQSIPKLVGGIDEISKELAVELYSAAVEEIIPVKSAEIAEAAKLLENIYRAVNIALVNEMKVLLTAMDINVWDVVEAAATKPFGFQPFYPGPGLGGHCIPIDPFYLSWKAREMGMSTRFIELAGEINHAMPDYVVQRTVLALNKIGKAAKGAKILVLGLAYKPDVDDVRESPSFEIIEKLTQLGADVDYNDPHVPKTQRNRRHDLQMESVALSPATLASYDAVVIATNHQIYDWSMISEHSQIVVDSRNAIGSLDSDNIVSA